MKGREGKRGGKRNKKEENKGKKKKPRDTGRYNPILYAHSKFENKGSKFILKNLWLYLQRNKVPLSQKNLHGK